MPENSDIRPGTTENAPDQAPEGGRGPLITSALAGRLIMVSAERVRQLAKEGWITKVGKDQYHLVDVVQGYIRFRNDAERRANKGAAEGRVREAKAREIELRNAQREGLLMETADAVAAVDEIIGTFRAQFAGLPARVTRDLQFRRTIETATNEILASVADIAVKKGLAVGTGGAPGAAGGAADAGSVGVAQSYLSAGGLDPGTA